MENKLPNCNICEYSNNSQFLIFETKFWKISLSETQEYLGRSYISLKRHSPSLSLLSIEEWLDFKQILTKLESSIKNAFGADLFNWSCLMNNAFIQTPAKPHVHWHLRPRYSKKVKFEGIIFEDPEFGHHYALSGEKVLNLSKDKMVKIIEKIKKNL